MKFPNGTFNATGMTAKNCIMWAYNAQPFQIEGGPSWITGQRYDMIAKLPAGAV
jgi:uncharacterized protein (TIGR03435 family)